MTEAVAVAVTERAGLTSAQRAPERGPTTGPSRPRAGSRASGARRSRRGPARRAPVRGADPPVRREAQPGHRPAQPLRDEPGHRRQREERDPRSRRQVEVEAGGQRKQRSAPPTSTTGAPGMADERVHRRELVVEPPAEEAEADEERRLDRIEAFLEVGRSPARRAGGAARPAARSAAGSRERVHVADHRPEAEPAGQRARRRRRRPQPPRARARAPPRAAPGRTGPPPTRVTGPAAR